MQEHQQRAQVEKRRRSNKPQHRQPAGLPPENDAQPNTGGDGTVHLTWGPLTENLDLAGMNVGEVYRLLRQPYRLAPEVRVNVNGSEADADTRLEAGDSLEFVRLAGEKGAG